MNFTTHEYYTEIQAIADTLAEEAMQQSENDREEAEELINDTLLHEAIDSHQWVIYYRYNLDVLQCSDNDEYFIQEFGDLEAGNILAGSGLSGLHSALAFWAMYADVQGYLEGALDKVEQATEEV